MKLFTKQIDDKLFAQYPLGNDLESQVVVAKIFNPYGKGTWYLLNSDPEDPDYLWAIVDFQELEIGSVSRSSLENTIIGPFKLNLERDLSFTPINAAELFNKLRQGQRHFKNGGGLHDKGGRISKGEKVVPNPEFFKGHTGKYKHIFGIVTEMPYENEQGVVVVKFETIQGGFEEQTFMEETLNRYVTNDHKQFAGGGSVSDARYIRPEEIIAVHLKNGKVFRNGYSTSDHVPMFSGLLVSDKPVTKDENTDQMELFKPGGKLDKKHLPKTAKYIKRADIEKVEVGVYEDEPDETIKGSHLFGGIWFDDEVNVQRYERAKAEGRFGNVKRAKATKKAKGEVFAGGGGVGSGQVWKHKHMDMTAVILGPTAKGYKVQTTDYTFKKPKVKIEYFHKQDFDDPGRAIFEKKFENGSMIGAGEDDMDLFEDYDSLPENVQEVLSKYSDEDPTYESLEQMQSELEPLGYTFEYGLDAVPYNLHKIYAGGGSTYKSGGKIYNAHILTDDNVLIHRRYKTKVTHTDIYNEYNRNGVTVKNSIIHHAKPVDFYDFLRSETKKYVNEKMNEDADASTIFIASKQVGNEYRATEIKGNTVSGKEFTITPKQLFEKQFADGGGVGEWKVGDKVSGSLVGSDYKENGTVIHVLSDGIVVSFPNGDEIKFDYDELEGMKIENKYAKGGPVLYGFQGADPETFVLNNHLGYGKIITNNSEGSDILFFDENRKKYFFKTILKGNQDTILKPKGIGYNRTGAKFNISKYFTPQMIEQYPTTDLRKTFAKGGGVGSGDDHITALGSFYQATSEFESKYKVGANQKLQKIVGKELYYKSEDGKKWFWNNPVIKKMTASELNALTKKIQDQMPGEKGWKHRHKA